MTATGFGTLVVALALTVAGSVLNYPELVAIGATGLAALAAAGGWLLGRPRLAITRWIEPTPVTEGCEAFLRLSVTNPGRARHRAMLANQMLGQHPIPIPLPRLRSGETHVASHLLPTERRGRYPIPPLTLERCDPFRLASRRKPTGSELELYVHPRTHYLAPLPTVGSADLDGSTSSRSRLGGVAFHSLREYVPGDDRRLIHWMSTARTGTLMVRHNVVPDQVRHVVLLDTSATAYSKADFEDAVRIAASWCEAAVRAGCPLSLRTTGGYGLVSSSMSLTEALDVLAEVTPSAHDAGLAAADWGQVQSEASLGVVTGRPSQADLAALWVLRSQVVAMAVAQFGETGTRPGWPPGVIAVAGGNSAELAAVWNQAGVQ